MVIQRRRGITTLGCLFTLLLLAAATYFAVNVGRPVYRSWLMRDAMHQEVKFAGMRTDAVIQRRLRERADQIGLPEEASRNLRVRRMGDVILIITEYGEHVEFPGFARVITFRPSAQGPF